MEKEFRIIKDKVIDDSRHITAIPSPKVCSEKIEFELKNGKIHNLVYTKGCNGNLQAVGRLLEGMEAKKAISVLSGINCKGRGTSCTDQLTQILTEL